MQAGAVWGRVVSSRKEPDSSQAHHVIILAPLEFLEESASRVSAAACSFAPGICPSINPPSHHCRNIHKHPLAEFGRSHCIHDGRLTSSPWCVGRKVCAILLNTNEIGLNYCLASTLTMADSSEQPPAELKHEGSETPGLAAEGADAPVASESAPQGTRQCYN